MDYICLYTIVNPISGITDYSCCPDFAEEKSRKGYLVFANLIMKPKVYFYRRV